VADINRRVTAAQAAAEREGERMSSALGAYGRASTELTSYVGVELRRLQETFEARQDQLEQILRGLPDTELEKQFRERLVRTRDLPLDKLDAPVADLLNHAAGHRGFAAQADLWFNPPVTVELSVGAARLSSVNERIVEVPFAMAGLARIPPPARILDIGSAESTFPLSAAALGYNVTAIDPRPLPYEHPNLEGVPARFEDWQAPSEPFSAVFLISTIEHVGLPGYGEQAYGSPDPGAGADRDMLNQVRESLLPNGLLVLTAPYGLRSVNDFERTYDAEALGELLEGWEVIHRQVVVRRDDLVWIAEANDAPGQPGVVMVLAKPIRA
jgi:2-polyprenyl-3-methyl-5-hydroxy-6-metoxy-1,4-benzoquinol methylase